MVSVISSMVTASGGPGGPVKEQDPQKGAVYSNVQTNDCLIDGSADPFNHLFTNS